MISDQNRLGALFNDPPGSLDEAIERMQFVDEDQEKIAGIREATHLPPESDDEAAERLRLAGHHPTNLLDFVFSDTEELMKALREHGWITKAKLLPGFQQQSCRRIYQVTAETNDHEIRLWTLEKDRPRFARIFYVRVMRSTDEEWKEDCNKALE
jgi:hypothetical protein